MAYDIFISYRRKGGAEKARPLKSELERRGYRVFLDFDELKDGVFDQRIMDAIDEAPIFLIILSANSLDRCYNEQDWVRKEIEYAIEKNKHFVPVNPNKEFAGIPQNIPEKVRAGLGLHQFSHIDFEQLFAASMDKMISERIEPYLNKARCSNRDNRALVRVEADIDCRALRFGQEQATIKAGKITELRLPKGKHKLSFVSLDEESLHEDIILTINDIEFEEYIEINLRERYDELKAKRERGRIAEEEARRKAEEEKARREAEKKRRAEEEARKKAEEEKARQEAEKKRRAEEEARRKAKEEKKLIAEEADRFFKKGDEWYNKGDYYTASLWFQKAADRGHAEAQRWVDRCHENYEHQTIVKPKVETQSKTDYTQRSNTTNETTQQKNLNTLFTQGLKDYNKGDFMSAVLCFRKAAEQGHTNSQYWLGHCYENGKGVDKNHNAAVLWYRNAAEQGNTTARYKLSKYDDAIRREKYREAQKSTEQQRQQTLADWFTKGLVSYQNNDFSTAFNWFRKAVHQAYPNAQLWLGYCYYHGKGVTKDYNSAFQWFQKAAVQGLAEAQYWLGYCYYHGKGVTKDYNSALQWFQKAAVQGLAKAKYMLGVCFEHGTGIKRDIEQAKKWYQRAADQGVEDAKKALRSAGKGFFGKLFG